MVDEQIESLLGFGRDFTRMIKMSHQKDGLVVLQDFYQLSSNPHGANHRHPCADPNDFNMFDFAKIRKHSIKDFVGQSQRIATRKNHLTQAWVGADIIERELILIGFNKGLLLPREMLARAIAAINAADICDQKKNPVWITMNDSGNRIVFLLAQGI